MPRFVLLHHVVPPGFRQGTHYDLMLEHEGQLLTWALAELPQANLTVSATQLPDHRLAYLEYEGPVSGDRGEVRRVDEGTFDWIEQGESQVRVLLRGRSQTATLELRREAGDQWTARLE